MITLDGSIPHDGFDVRYFSHVAEACVFTQSGGQQLRLPQRKRDRRSTQSADSPQAPSRWPVEFSPAARERQLRRCAVLTLIATVMMKDYTGRDIAGEYD